MMFWRAMSVWWCVILIIGIFVGSKDAFVYSAAIMTMLSLGVDDILKAIRNEQEGK